MTEGDLTTLNILTEMGESQRQGQTRAARGVKQLTCWLLWDWLMDQSSPDVDKARGNGNYCREMTNRQEGYLALTRLGWDVLDSCSWVVEMHREEEGLIVDQRL